MKMISNFAIIIASITIFSIAEKKLKKHIFDENVYTISLAFNHGVTVDLKCYLFIFH